MGFSKSKYTSGLQCPKILWMQDHMKEEFDESLVNAGIMSQGNEVGELARGYYGKFVLVNTNVLPLSVACTLTNALLEINNKALEVNGNPTNIAEATFEHEGNLCSVDILRCIEKNTVEIVEVKSATKIKPYYYDDATYQTWVLMQCGYKVSAVKILHVNNNYVRHGDIDLLEMFTEVDITEKVKERIEDVPAIVERLQEYRMLEEEPFVAPGEQCSCPHKCGFFKHCCLQYLPEDNLFEVQGTSWKNGLKDLERGYKTFEDLLANKTLKGFKYAQVKSKVFSEPIIKRDKIAEELKKYHYPLYFLDYETINAAIPPFDNASPYEQIPTQYSLHIMYEDGHLEHREFLGEAGTDPRRDLAEALCRDIPEDVCVIAYNQGFEKGRTKAMASLFPDLHNHLMRIHDNFVDLMVPFQKGWYYLPAMGKSYSIKYVLPALYPDDPTLDYHNLVSVSPNVEVIRKGDAAADAFLHLSEHSPEEQEAIRKNLLQYCKLDTYAMVKVFEALQDVVKTGDLHE